MPSKVESAVQKPTYRSEFVMRLQSMRQEKRSGLRFSIELLDEPIAWMPSTSPKFCPKTVSFSNTMCLTSEEPDKVRVKKATFNEFIDIYEVEDYDRKVDKPWNRLTDIEKVVITVIV